MLQQRGIKIALTSLSSRRARRADRAQTARRVNVTELPRKLRVFEFVATSGAGRIHTRRSWAPAEIFEGWSGQSLFVLSHIFLILILRFHFPLLSIYLSSIAKPWFLIEVKWARKILPFYAFACRYDFSRISAACPWPPWLHGTPRCSQISKWEGVEPDPVTPSSV